MKTLDESFEKNKENRGLFKSLKESYMIKKNWKTIVGEQLEKQLVFLYLKQDECVVSAVNPCWIKEIAFYEKEIIQKLNTTLKRSPKIKRVKMRVN